MEKMTSEPMHQRYKRLTTLLNVVNYGHEVQHKPGLRKVRYLREGLQEAQAAAKVLLDSMQVEGVAQKTSKNNRTRLMEGVVLPYFQFGSPHDCAYCGDKPDTKDHVIPVSFQYQGRRDRIGIKRMGPWCWACRDCNSRLSARYFDSFKQRCEWISEWLRGQAFGLHVSRVDISILDYNLQRLVEQRRAKIKWLIMRSEWYQSREYYGNLESLVWHVSSLDVSKKGQSDMVLYFRPTIIDIARSYYGIKR